MAQEPSGFTATSDVELHEGSMIHEVIPIRYDRERNTQFQRVLKRRVRTYLATQKQGAKANGFMWFKVVFYIGAYLGNLATLTFVRHSLLVTLALIVLQSMLVVGLAYNVAHDAVHNTLSKKKWVNELLFYATFNFFGPNAYLWRYRHVVMHHAAVNVPGWDFNIEAADILRFAPTQKWRPIHRFQHLYAPFAYLIFTFHWVFIKDFQMLLLDRIGNVGGIKHPWWRTVELVAWKLLHVGMLIVLPIVMLGVPAWQVILAYLFFQLMTSFQFVLTFTASHLNEGLVFVEAGDKNDIPHSFLEHALHTSLDFSPTDPVVSFWLGGFNSHVAHHMFPNICSVHYPALTREIQRTAEEFGLPYKAISFFQVFTNHFAYLKQMGHDALSPFETYMHKAPETKAPQRDAVRPHGRAALPASLSLRASRSMSVRAMSVRAMSVRAMSVRISTAQVSVTGRAVRMAPSRARLPVSPALSTLKDTEKR
jgi:linoleoyl-CoA desaturase